jgi:hypothetical protein
MMRTTKYKVAGGILVAIAGIGFLTVADELRHIGEFFGVLGILLSGMAFLVAGFVPRASTMFALQWVAMGIGAGMIGGAATDRMVAGVSVGTAFGLLLAFILRTKPKSN